MIDDGPAHCIGDDSGVVCSCGGQLAEYYDI
jgi:hypothetical protein